tara:strand:+ start:1063 stop:1320 length:258 start_codon:yes stop_codon:yes gene_type:complete
MKYSQLRLGKMKSVFKKHRGIALSSCYLVRIFKLALITFLAVSCGSDPYKQCMKEEKRKNAYLGEDDYLRESSKICARKVRQLES